MSIANGLRWLLGLAAFLLTSGFAVAEPPHGYWVRSSGYYDRFPYPPAYGGHFDYSPGRPTVTYRGASGSLVTVPLQPKVLYYSTPFATPGGYYYPTTITLIPDDRHRPRIRPHVASPAPTYRYDGGPANPVPMVEPDRRRN